MSYRSIMQVGPANNTCRSLTVRWTEAGELLVCRTVILEMDAMLALRRLACDCIAIINDICI